jgi:S1-C subfamily serine protease
MNRRYVFTGAVVAAILLALTAVNIRNTSWTGSPARAVAERGPLSEGERATIDIFERVSPSVVQVAARGASNPLMDEDEGQARGQAASGTGFVWDNEGHIVTNDHVVQNARQVAIRFASGEVAQTELIGVAPNYDLAVLRIMSVRSLPPPLAIGGSADLRSDNPPLRSAIPSVSTSR